MLLSRSTPIRQQQPLHHGRSRVIVQVRAAAAKGFGDPKPKAAAVLKCACGSKLVYKDCCEPIHTDKAIPTTGEAALRSRFSAFSKGEVDFLVATDLRETITPEQRKRDSAAACNTFSYSDLKVLQVEAVVADPAGSPTQCIKFQFNSKKLERRPTKANKAKKNPAEDQDRLLDGTMKVYTTVERSKFIKCTSGAWALAESERISHEAASKVATETASKETTEAVSKEATEAAPLAQ